MIEQYLRLVGTGSFLPRREVGNEQLRRDYDLDTSHEWIYSRSGIASRFLASEDETTAYMGLAAARHALEDSDWEARDIDLIICATCTPDRSLPSVALDLHQKLSCKSECAAFDVAAACSGFIYALNIADSMMKAQNHIERALIVCSERMSSIVNWKDRSTAVLFGDGAGAALFERADFPGHYHSRIYAQGDYSQLLHCETGSNKIYMEGRAVFRHAVEKMDRLVETLLKESGLERSDIDRLVPHQANSRIIQTLANKLKLEDSQVVMNIEKTGNTSAASIPIALDQGIRGGVIKKGQVVLMEAFGAGFVWGGSLLKY